MADDKSILTQKELARHMGVSAGTVDRALHNRDGISPEVRERILAAAAELGYTPNAHARALVNNRKKTVIDVVTPIHSQFWSDLLAGVRDAAAQWKDFHLELRCKSVIEGDIADELRAMYAILDERPDGLVFVPFNPHLLRESVDRAVRLGIRVITVNRDCPGCGRVCYVGSNPRDFGALCAKYYARFVRPGAQVMVLVGTDGNEHKRQRTQGFVDTLSAGAPQVHLLPPQPFGDPQYEVYESVSRALAANKNLGGVFVNTASGVYGAAQAIGDAAQSDRCFLMGIDVTETTTELMDRGILPFTISQNPYVQGYHAMSKMCALLFQSVMPDREHYYADLSIVVDREHYGISSASLR